MLFVLITTPFPPMRYIFHLSDNRTMTASQKEVCVCVLVHEVVLVCKLCVTHPAFDIKSSVNEIPTKGNGLALGQRSILGAIIIVTNPSGYFASTHSIYRNLVVFADIH